MAQSEKRRFVRRYRYYEILEVPRTATQAEIKRAFRKLAKQYQEVFTNINPDPKAVEKFKNINKAYEVLSDSKQRVAYDDSPAECPNPDCGTHEVIQTIGTQWRCTRCGSKFDPSRVSETIWIIEAVEAIKVTESLRRSLRIFQGTQCSWCKKFYTQEPFQCPHRRLQSNCISFDRLDEEERASRLGNEKWWWKVYDMVQQVKEKGVMARCRVCGAFNPNPNRLTLMCWRCQEHSLGCPALYRGTICGTLLEYDTEKDIWKCRNAACSKKYKWMPKKRPIKPTITHEICPNPNCGRNLHYDNKLLLWRCLDGCKRIYTYQELRNTKVKEKESPRPKEQRYTYHREPQKEEGTPSKPQSAKPPKTGVKPRQEKSKQVTQKPSLKPTRKLSKTTSGLIAIIVFATGIVLFLPLIRVPVQTTEVYYEAETKHEPYTVTENYETSTQHYLTIYRIDGDPPPKSCVIVIPNRLDNSIRWVQASGYFLAGLKTWQRLLTETQTVKPVAGSQRHRVIIEVIQGKLRAGIEPVKLYANILEIISRLSGMDTIEDSKRIEYYFDRMPQDCDAVMAYFEGISGSESASMSVKYEWDTIQTGTREVTKYREVPVQVEKQRTVTEYKKISLFEWLFRQR